MNWEIGIDIYTLICIKWVTNKNPLYKKIDKIKFKKKKNYSMSNIYLKKSINHDSNSFELPGTLPENIFLAMKYTRLTLKIT